jgi:hypothetical protein
MARMREFIQARHEVGPNAGLFTFHFLEELSQIVGNPDATESMESDGETWRAAIERAKARTAMVEEVVNSHEPH